MKQKAVVVKVDITDEGLKVEELNSALDDGWTVDSTQTSTPGSILVILKKD